MSPEHEPTLVVEGLEVRYSGVPAVRGIDFTINRGETVGLIGPNGAGKSSTMLAMMGAVKASAGSVKLNGLELIGMNPEIVITKGLALVPEGRHIFGNLTVHQNLRLGEVGRRSRDGLADDIEWVLELFPILREFQGRTAGLLSGGQQQQLAIARSLLAKPDVLMLDEPSLGLSPTAVDTVFEALAQVRDNGTSILVVEQRAEYTIAFCDRTHVLYDGQLTLELRPEDAEDDELLTKAYFGS
ncbi:ABC transporter ATP-binding protein [Enemella sp. A6]|uniref:ABC transporter ATP-binding protein n=1 Tax=Enemella sp. A6 TaxID=3440152 RepID=UPI003EB76479